MWRDGWLKLAKLGVWACRGSMLHWTAVHWTAVHLTNKSFTWTQCSGCQCRSWLSSAPSGWTAPRWRTSRSLEIIKKVKVAQRVASIATGSKLSNFLEAQEMKKRVEQMRDFFLIWKKIRGGVSDSGKGRVALKPKPNGFWYEAGFETGGTQRALKKFANFFKNLVLEATKEMLRQL